jgi:hypothetical protein
VLSGKRRIREDKGVNMIKEHYNIIISRPQKTQHLKLK